MAELFPAMGRHGIAAMQIGVDQLAQGGDTLQNGIDLDPELSQDCKVRTLTGGAHDFVDRFDPGLIFGLASDGLNTAPLETEFAHAELGDQFDGALALCRLYRPSKGDARWRTLPVVLGQLRKVFAANCPNDFSVRNGPFQLDKVENNVRSGVTRPDDQNAFAGVTLSVTCDRIWNAVSDSVSQTDFARCRQAVGSNGIGGCPGARRVDHSAGFKMTFHTFAIAQMQDERLTHTTRRLNLVSVAAGDSRDLGIKPQVGGGLWNRGQRLQISLNEQCTRGKIFPLRRHPAVALQKLLSRKIDQRTPGREQGDMRPIADVACDTAPAFEDDWRQSSVEEMGRCGKTDRARTNYRYWERRVAAH